MADGASVTNFHLDTFFSALSAGRRVAFKKQKLPLNSQSDLNVMPLGDPTNRQPKWSYLP